MFGIFKEKRLEGEVLLPLSTSSASKTTDFEFIASSARWRHAKNSVLSGISNACQFAIPSFLQRSSEPTTKLRQPKLPTEYLDGVRGLASLIVFIFHWTHLSYRATNSGYGSSKNPSLWQLPMIRFVYSGPAMVSIFFVVSGYVLTYRFIHKMHRQDWALYGNLTSLTFRRALRLFLPSLASCILAFVATAFGFVNIPTEINKRPFHHGVPALLDYIDHEFNPWVWDIYMEGFYNPQLWSIAVEFRGSMVVFLAILALAKTRTSIRMLVEILTVIHAFLHKRWDIALFMAGMLIAEIDIFVQNSDARKEFLRRKRTKTLLYLILIAGVWLSGYPRDHATASYGYSFLQHFWPSGDYQRRFWLGISAILIILPMPFLPSLQSFFNTAPIRYLGKISFALYLLHGLTNRTMGLWLIYITRVVVGGKGYWAYATSFMISSVLYTPFVFWWSDLFWRAVDVPATEFARWIEQKCASRIET